MFSQTVMQNSFSDVIENTYLDMVNNSNLFTCHVTSKNLKEALELCGFTNACMNLLSSEAIEFYNKNRSLNYSKINFTNLIKGICKQEKYELAEWIKINFNIDPRIFLNIAIETKNREIINNVIGNEFGVNTIFSCFIMMNDIEICLYYINEHPYDYDIDKMLYVAFISTNHVIFYELYEAHRDYINDNDSIHNLVKKLLNKNKHHLFVNFIKSQKVIDSFKFHFPYILMNINDEYLEKIVSLISFDSSIKLLLYNYKETHFERVMHIIDLALGNNCVKLFEFSEIPEFISFIRRNSKLNLDTDTCSICFEELKCNNNLIITNCGHCFHKDCLSEWFKRRVICPMCRNTNLSRGPTRSFQKRLNDDKWETFDIDEKLEDTEGKSEESEDFEIPLNLIPSDDNNPRITRSEKRRKKREMRIIGRYLSDGLK